MFNRVKLPKQADFVIVFTHEFSYKSIFETFILFTAGNFVVSVSLITP